MRKFLITIFLLIVLIIAVGGCFPGGRQQINVGQKESQVLRKAAEAEVKGNYEEALFYYKEELKLCESYGNTRSPGGTQFDRKGWCKGLSCFNIGRTYFMLSRYEEALQYLKEALRYAELPNTNLSKIQKNILSFIRQVYVELGRPDEAEKYAGDTTTAKPDKVIIGLDRDSRDKLKNKSPDVAQKIDGIEQLLRISESVRALSKQAEREMIRGLYHQALSTYDRAIELLNNNRIAVGSVGTSAQMIQLWNGKALIHYKLEDFGKAESCLQETERFEEETRQAIQATFSKIKSSGGKVRQLPPVRGLGSERQALLVDIYAATGRQSEAFDLLKKISGELTESPGMRIRYHSQMGALLSKTGNLAQASGEYLQAVTLIEEIRGKIKEREGFFTAENRLNAYRGLIGVLSERTLQGEKDLASRAFTFSEATKARTLIEKIAEAERRAGEVDLADDLRRRESSLLNEQSQFNSEADSIYAKGEEAVKAFKERRTKANSELNALIQELWERYPKYAALHYPRPMQAEKLPLQEGEVLIEYALSDDAGYVFVVRKGGVHRIIRIPVGREKLEEMVKAVMNPLNTRQLTTVFIRDAKALYDLLLAEALKGVKATERVIIVPDGILGLLPFEALVIGEGRRPEDSLYVGDLYRFTYSQSATVLALNRLLKPSQAVRPLFALGNPIYNKNDPRYVALRQEQRQPVVSAEDLSRYAFRALATRKEWGKVSPDDREGKELVFPPLPETEMEVKRIAGLFGISPNRPDILLGIYANETTLKKSPLKEYRYLHFATHGDLPGKVQGINEPFLLLGQVENEGGDNGFLTLTKVIGLSLDAEMVVLSACLTGRGKVMEGEGVANFARAFQHAGSRSVVVSLWEVASYQTVEYMVEFYKYLKGGKSRIEALSLARKQIKEKYPHPFYWAPFVLYGEP